jgi:hypothetical protein
MSNITKNHKVGIFAVFIASALMLGAISVSGIDSAFATSTNSQKSSNSDRSDDRDNRSNENEGEQEIEQTQVSKQSSSCNNSGAVVVSALCGNNVAIQLNANLAGNTLGQE